MKFDTEGISSLNKETVKPCDTSKLFKSNVRSVSNKPVDTSSWYVNPDAYVLIGVVKDNIPLTEVVNIIKFVVCTTTGVPWQDILTRERKRKVTEARQLFHYFVRKYTSMSLSSIGMYGGGRDHSTVLHSLRTINSLIDTDKSKRELVNKINTSIQSKMSFNNIDDDKGVKPDTIADWDKVKHKYINQMKKP